MNGTLLLFDGQGAFTPGFGKEWLKETRFRQTIEAVSDHARFDVADFAWGASRMSTAKRNRELQLVLLALNIGLASVLRERGVPGLLHLAGHSLGELCALTDSGALDLQSGVALVDKRGTVMAAAGARIPQDMLVVMASQTPELEKILERFPSVCLANDNAPEQRVYAGPLDQLKELQAQMKVGSKILGTHVACHSPLLNEGVAEMTALIDALPIREPRDSFFCVAANAWLSDPEAIRAHLRGHMTGPVHWRRAMETWHSQGFREAIEVGPSKILKGLALRQGAGWNVKTVLEVIK